MPKKIEVRKDEQAVVAPQESLPSAPAELVADRGMSEAEWMSEYVSSLKVYGETVEDRISKEFRPWMLKFAQVVAADTPRLDAWEKLKVKCDVLLLLGDLYLFTYPEDAQH